MEVKGHSGEVSNGSEKQIIRNGREKKKKKKREERWSLLKVAKNVTELGSPILWKVELVNDEIWWFLSKMLKVQPGSFWLLILKCKSSVRWTEEGIIEQKWIQCRDLENSQSVLIAKNEEDCSEENTVCGWTTIW